MNRRLLDPFQSVQLPEIIEEYLDSQSTRCIALNSRGTLLAAGCSDGEVVVWDLETRGVARTYKPHKNAVTAVCWSRNGKLLLSGGVDGLVCWRDMLNDKQAMTVELGSPITKLSIVPRQPYCCLVSFSSGPPALVTVSDGAADVKRLPALVIEGEGKSCDVKVNPQNVVPIAVFDTHGERLYLGAARGTVAVLDPRTTHVLDIIRISGTPKVMHMTLNRKGTYLLVDCSDRSIRMFQVAQTTHNNTKTYTLQDVKSKVAVSKVPKHGSILHPHEPLLQRIREFHNAVERMSWRAVCFTADSEYVVAAPDNSNEHNMYIWSRLWGKLERILEGPKEGIVDIAAHPLQSILLSVSSTGKIYIWSTVYRENWSAFAPDFEELEENQEYIEREDEFDVNERTDDKDNDRQGSKNGDDAAIDILTVEEVAVLSSDDEEDAAGLYYLPVDIVPQHSSTTNGVVHNSHNASAPAAAGSRVAPAGTSAAPATQQNGTSRSEPYGTGAVGMQVDPAAGIEAAPQSNGVAAAKPQDGTTEPDNDIFERPAKRSNTGL